MTKYMLMFSILAFACVPSTKHTDVDVLPSEPSATEPVHVTFGEEADGVEVVTLQGLIDIDSVAGEQGFVGVWLEASSKRYVLAFRPEDRYLPLQGKRVTVTGYVECTPPDVHAVGSTYFVVQDIQAAL